MKNINRIIWGSILIIVGVLFALNALEITDIDIFFDGWWTLLIIIPCGVGIFTDRAKFGNFIGLLSGVFLLLCCQNILDFGMIWKLAFPVLIVALGAKMLFGTFFGSKNTEMIRELRNGEEPESHMAAFSGQTLNFSGEVFEGMQLTAVFGGIKLDLTNAIMEKNCLVDATAIFGGITIYVPKHVNVQIRSNSLFGGVSEKGHQNSKDNTVTLYVDASCMFGGVEIK